MLFRFLRLSLFPPLIGAKNRFLRSRKNRRYAFLSLLVLAIIEYILFSTGVNLARDEPSILSSVLFGMILSGASVTFLAALVRTVSNLFISTDATLFTIAPLTPWTHFSIRFSSIFFSSSWSVFFFVVPFFLGICSARQEINFFLLIITATSLLACSASCAFLLIVLLNTIFSASFLRDIGLISFFGLLLCASIFSLFFDTTVLQVDISKPLLQKISFFIPLIDSLGSIALVSIAFAGISLILAKIIFKKYYFHALSKVSNHKSTSIIFARVVPALFLSKYPTLRAITIKEYRSLFRDTLQLLQLLLFLGLTLLYLNFSRNIGRFPGIPTKALPYWDMIKFTIHIIGSGLLLSGFAVRMIFPSFSLEGANVWILQSAPLSEKRFFLSKLFAWILPLSSLGLILSLSAMLSLNLSPELIIVGCMSFLFSVISVGISALSFGAHFSRFDWQHPGQLTGGWASLVCFIFTFSSYIFSIALPFTGAILFFLSKSLTFTEFLLLTLAQTLVVGLFAYKVTKSTLPSIKSFSEARAIKVRQPRRIKKSKESVN